MAGNFSLGEAVLGTAMDLSGLVKGMKDGGDEATGWADKLGNVLKVGLVGAGVAAGAAIGAMFIAGIDDAREANMIMAQTEATIKATGGAAGVTAQHVADYAASLSAASGKSLFGDSQIQESSNLLLTFKNIKGATLDAATAMTTDLAQALGGAPADQAMMLGKALDNPIKGISALGKAGLTFSEEQKTMIASMQASGDMAGAQAIILQELNSQVGGSAQAAAIADGGWAQLKDRMGEAGETVGAAVLPILGLLVGVLLDTVMPAFEAVTATIATVITSFQAGGENSAVLGTAVQALGVMWQWLLTAIQPVVDAIYAVVIAVFGQLQTFIAAHGAEISAFMTEAWNQIMAIVKTGIELYNAIVSPILTAIAGFINSHGKEIQAIFTAVWDTVKALITAALAIIQGVLKTALQLIQGDWSGAWETVKSTVSTVWDSIKTVISSAWDVIVTLFGGFASQALDMGANIINGIVQGVKDGVGALTSAITGAARDALAAAKSALGISSPSRVFADVVGATIPAGIAQGIVDNMGPLHTVMNDLSGLASSVRMPGLPGLGGGGAGMSGMKLSGGASVKLNVDESGLGWLKNLVKVEIKSNDRDTARGADIRLRG